MINDKLDRKQLIYFYRIKKWSSLGEINDHRYIHHHVEHFLFPYSLLKSAYRNDILIVQLRATMLDDKPC